jgi:hypothetical protein
VVHWRALLFLFLAFSGTHSSNATTMANKSLSTFSHEERTISPETASQASDQPGDIVSPQPGDNVSPPTPRTPNDSFKLEDNLTEGVSFLTNAIQFANKPFRTASKMDFLYPFFIVGIHKLQNRPSMPVSLCQSRGGANCMPQITWVPFLFLRHMESMQLYKSESYVFMLQMMNLTKMVIPHCIFNMTQPGTSTMPQ